MTGMSLTGNASTRAAFRQLRREFGPSENGDVVYVVGTNVEYAAYVELGTSRMQAQPYLFPAAKRVSRDPGRHVGQVRSVDDMVRKVALAIEREAKERAPVDTGRLRASIEATRVR